MSRVFWFAAGAASGVYGLVKVKRTARNRSEEHTSELQSHA